MTKLTQKIINKAIVDNNLLLDTIAKSLNVSNEELIKVLGDKEKPKETDKKNAPDENKNIGENSAIIHIDGGSRGNPGISGAGIIVETKEFKKGYYFYTGIKTNNQAEYTGLLKALEISKKLDLRKIQVYTDSQLLCRQINGMYKVENLNLKELYLQAKEMIKGFDNFSITHVMREKNREADKMANMAMDKKENNEVELTVAR